MKKKIILLTVIGILIGCAPSGDHVVNNVIKTGEGFMRNISFGESVSDVMQKEYSAKIQQADDGRHFIEIYESFSLWEQVLNIDMNYFLMLEFNADSVITGFNLYPEFRCWGGNNAYYEVYANLLSYLRELLGNEDIYDIPGNESINHNYYTHTWHLKGDVYPGIRKTIVLNYSTATNDSEYPYLSIETH